MFYNWWMFSSISTHVGEAEFPAFAKPKGLVPALIKTGLLTSPIFSKKVSNFWLHVQLR